MSLRVLKASGCQCGVTNESGRALAERRLWGRNALPRVLGVCCGHRFYTWESWRDHRRSFHRYV